jgi:GMP reductase
MYKFYNDQINLDFKDVLIVPRDSNIIISRFEVNLVQDFVRDFRYYKRELKCIPIIASNMSSIGTLSMAKELSKYKCLTVLHKYIDYEKLNEMIEQNEIDPTYVFVSCGAINQKEIYNIEKILDTKKIDKLCIDIANGYLDIIISTIKYFRKKYPDILIMTGNVVHQERCNKLSDAGADIVKIGIGGGSCCLTREKTGVGYPQLSCILDCNKDSTCRPLLASDGGCSTPSDICKAFGAGAHFVMLGGMLGGHDECEGEIVEIDGNKKMLIYGMSSETAQNLHNGGMEKYRTSEGRTLHIDYKGSVKNTLDDILGGLRSYGTYIGSDNIAKFNSFTQFIKVNRQLNNPFNN